MKPSKLAGCNVRTQKDPPKPERNHPCPCLSGKKYKKCCGDPAWLSQKRKEDDARFFAALKKKEEERKAEQEAEHPRHART